MYNILFSFLKPQIAFGGDSGGGGGSSSGGGGSRADKKGAAAVLSAPKPRPAPTPPPAPKSRRRSPATPAPAPVVSPVTAAAEDDNRSIFDRLENIQLVSKDLGGEGEDVLRRRESQLNLPAKEAPEVLRRQASQLNITAPPVKASPVVPVKKSGITSGLDPNAKVDLYNFANQFDPSKDMPGSPRNLQQEEDLQERMMRQNIAAAIDPYGQSTATDSNLTSRAVDMLNKGNMSKEQYEQSVKNLGLRLDQPRFGDSGLGKMFEASPLGQGEHSDTAQVFDETVDAQKAKDYTKVYDMGDPSRLDGSDNNDRQRAGAEDEAGDGAQDPTCPDGYIFDSEENACVLDPFQQPFPEAPTTGGGTYTAPALSPYTSVAPVTLPSLMPVQQQQYMVPAPNVQPITVAAQTPVGLASLRRS